MHTNQKTQRKRTNSGRSNHNIKLSSVCSVIETVIARLKKWRILKGQYRHFSTTKNNQLNMNLIIQVVIKFNTIDLKRTLHDPRIGLFQEKNRSRTQMNLFETLLNCNIVQINDSYMLFLLLFFLKNWVILYTDFFNIYLCLWLW
jgi:hypothetical protein